MNVVGVAAISHMQLLLSLYSLKLLLNYIQYALITTVSQRSFRIGH